MSIHLVFPNPDHQQRLRAGPLAGDIDGFAAWLAGEGYGHSSAKDEASAHRRLKPLARRARAGDRGCQRAAGRGVLARAQAATRRPYNRSAIAGVFAQIAAVCRLPCAVRPSTARLERIARTYELFLIDQRAVSPATVKNYLPVVRAFLDERFGSREIDLASLSARDANQFVRREAERLSRSRAKLVVTALRSFLRHLHQHGDLQADLASAVLPVMRWRLSGLPKSLAPEQVRAILASCDRETLVWTAGLRHPAPTGSSGAARR